MTKLSTEDKKALQANNWRVKEVLRTRGPLTDSLRDLLEDVLNDNYEILDEENPSHVDTDTLPNTSESPFQPYPRKGSNGKRVALFVGHNKGTGARSHDGQDEWTTRNEVATKAAEILHRRGYTVGIFYRDRSLGYTSAMRKHGTSSREFGADVSLELHFNNADGTAKGAEIIVYSTRTEMTLGRAFTEATLKKYPRSVLRGDRGVKVKTSGRGAGFNRYQPCPSGIYEPCFADTPSDWARFKDDVDREAEYVAEIIEQFFAA